jgi:hypothetical protein
MDNTNKETPAQNIQSWNPNAPNYVEMTDAEMLVIKQNFGWYNDPKYPDWK